MMDFGEIHDRLITLGYADDTAYARIAHDVILKAVFDSGFHNFLTIKGGVVMSGLTDIARRATMDMDLDFMQYPLTNVSIQRFIAELNRVAPCRIRIQGGIVDLRQQEYKGKRVHLQMQDSNGNRIDTKLDIGVHSHIEVAQTEFTFRVVTDDSTVRLLVNSAEQIFVEKLKSLLRLGTISTRYKDIFDLYYLSSRVSREKVYDYLMQYVVNDSTMRENGVEDIKHRLERIFSSESFRRGLLNPANAWLAIPPVEATSRILSFITSLR